MREGGGQRRDHKRVGAAFPSPCHDFNQASFLSPHPALVRHVEMQVLRNFDSLISSNCTEELENAGVEVLKFSQVRGQG